MSLKGYSKYYDTGIQWINRLPVGWQVAKLGGVGASGMGQTILREDVSEVPAPGYLPVYSASEGDELFGYLESPNVVLGPGDIVIGARGSIGYARKLKAASTCTQTTIWFKPNTTQINSSYLYWVMTGCRKSLFPFDQTAVPMLTVAQVRAGRVPTPPTSEQVEIADFLDRETARIDALIAAQERLIALLQEKRKAIISQAVTKGLDPNVPMKDSGVEWIGQIPENWNIRTIRSLAREGADAFVDGDWIESPFITDEGVRLIQTGNIGVGCYREQGFRYVSEQTFTDLRCTEVVPGDVLICRLADPVGRACLAPALGSKMITSVDVCILRVEPNVDANFIVYLFTSAQYLGHMEAQCRGGTRDRVSRSALGRVQVPLPPVAEQHRIVTFLHSELETLHMTEQGAQEAVHLLRERRSALITAAVTGQIDVRGLAEAAA